MDILDIFYSDLGQLLIWLPTVLLTLLILAVIITGLWIFFPILFLIMINRLGKIDRQLTKLIKIKEKSLNISADETPTLGKTVSKNHSQSNKNNST